MKYLFLLLSLSFMFLSCSKDDNPTESQGSSAFIPLPLKFQNYWTFNSTTPSGITEYTNTITSTTVINNETIFVFNDDWLFDKDGFYYSDGALYGLKVSNPSNTTELIFPKNPSVGQMWTITGEGFTLLLEAINVSVTVPAGTFSCYKILSTPPSGSTNTQFYLYWSNGIGPVKAEDKNNLSNKDELKGYKVN